MERECPICCNMVQGEDAKGDGVHLTYICDECGVDLDDCI